MHKEPPSSHAYKFMLRNKGKRTILKFRTHRKCQSNPSQNENKVQNERTAESQHEKIEYMKLGNRKRIKEIYNTFGEVITMNAKPAAFRFIKRIEINK